MFIPRTYQEDSEDTRAEYPPGHYVQMLSVDEVEARLLRAFATAINVEDARGWQTGQQILKAMREGFNGNA